MEQKLEERRALLSQLLDGVKQCQIKYGGRRELATDMDGAVRSLCNQLEAVLQHGIRRPELNTLRQVRDAIAENLSINLNLPGTDADPALLWQLVKVHLSRHELERYLLLVNVNTDAGRARAWLRSALNDATLERYMLTLTEDRNAMTRFYEPWALMADQEMSSLLPNVAAGLSSILFAISIDRAELNGQAGGSPRLPDPEATVLAQSFDIDAPPRRRRRRVRAQLVSFDSEDVSSQKDAASAGWVSAPATCVSSPAPAQQSAKSFSYDGGGRLDPDPEPQDNCSSASGGDDLSCRSDNASVEDGALLRLCDPEGSGGDALTPLHFQPSTSPGDLQRTDKGLCNGIISPIANQEYPRSDPSELRIHWTAPQSDRLNLRSDPSLLDKSDQKDDLTAPAAVEVSALSVDELRQAFSAVSDQRSTLSRQVTEIQQRLEHSESQCSTLQSEAALATADWERRFAELESRRVTSERENVVLKRQLKDYVSAVRMLRDGSPTETLQQIKPSDKPVKDYHAEAEAYQQKLIQVAEMHGELMEFNERLRLQLTRKERQVSELLAELGISEALISEGDADIALLPPRVNCWIPSAFLSGSGTSAHHVYQVYIRIRDEEWNVYHRYSTFNQLYNKLKKEHPDVKRFNFPRKKTINNRDVKVVEQRRRQLQEFLRCVTRSLLSADPQLARALSRAALIAAEPFFGPQQTAPSASEFGRPTTDRRYTGL